METKVITSLLLFDLYFFEMHVSVMETIKKIQRQLSWGWETDRRKIT